MKKLFLASILLILSAGFLHSQPLNVITDIDYKFAFELPNNVTKVNKVEALNKTSIKYDLEYTEGEDTVVIYIVAIKYPDIRRLSDLVYNVEKEKVFNIQKREGDYIEFDSVYYDGKSAIYLGKDLAQVVYFYRTKDESQNVHFTYILGFNMWKKIYGDHIIAKIREIAEAFKPSKIIQ